MRKKDLFYSSSPSEKRYEDLAAYYMVESIFMGMICLTMLAKETSVLNKITSGNCNLLLTNAAW